MKQVSNVDGVRHESETGTYHARHEWESGAALSETVIEVVAVATDSEPTSYRPLQETIDVDSLDRLYQPRPGATMRQNGGCLSFTFGDCDITVYWDGTIDVVPHDRMEE